MATHGTLLNPTTSDFEILVNYLLLNEVDDADKRRAALPASPGGSALRTLINLISPGARREDIRPVNESAS